MPFSKRGAPRLISVLWAVSMLQIVNQWLKSSTSSSETDLAFESSSTPNSGNDGRTHLLHT